jgi:hypothetical protein
VAIVAADDRGWCCPVEPACAADCGCSDVAVVTPAADVSACCEEIPCGAALDALDVNSVVVAAPVVTAEPDALGSVVVSGAGPTLAPAPRPTEPVPAPIAAAPGLEPIEPVSASEPPAMEPAPVGAEPAAEPPAVKPAPRNAFEEADAALAPDLDGLVPAAEPAPPPAPAAEPAAEPRAAREPLRRWIDDTAAYAVVGRLIDVRDDRVEILKADGRSVTVPLARLSGLDRDYVAGAAGRIASNRPRSPRPTDTAGR